MFKLKTKTNAPIAPVILKTSALTYSSFLLSFGISLATPTPHAQRSPLPPNLAISKIQSSLQAVGLLERQASATQLRATRLGGCSEWRGVGSACAAPTSDSKCGGVLRTAKGPSAGADANRP